MDISSQDGKEKKKITKVKTFPVQFPLGENQGNPTININTPSVFKYLWHLQNAGYSVEHCVIPLDLDVQIDFIILNQCLGVK